MPVYIYYRTRLLGYLVQSTPQYTSELNYYTAVSELGRPILHARATTYFQVLTIVVKTTLCSFPSVESIIISEHPFKFSVLATAELQKELVEPLSSSS